jgi:hypothetical protein
VPLKRKKWLVWAKPPFSGPEAVLAYLARYTHRAAIANSRLIALDQRGVTFRFKDYRRNGQARYRTMTLSVSCSMFYQKGFTASAATGCWPAPAANIARAKELTAAPMPAFEPPAAHDTADPDATRDHRPPCPFCGGRMIIVEVFGRGGSPRGPPPSDAGVRTATP